MRWTTKSTWIRIAVLFGIYLLVPAAWFGVSRASDSMEIDSALIYGVGYSILGFVAHGVGALIHARRTRRVSPRANG